MLAASMPRKPAPMLAMWAAGARGRVGPYAFGNALGSSLANASNSDPLGDFIGQNQGAWDARSTEADRESNRFAMGSALDGSSTRVAAAGGPWGSDSDGFPQGVPRNARFLEGVNGGAGAPAAVSAAPYEGSVDEQGRPIPLTADQPPPPDGTQRVEIIGHSPSWWDELVQGVESFFTPAQSAGGNSAAGNDSALLRFAAVEARKDAAYAAAGQVLSHNFQGLTETRDTLVASHLATANGLDEMAKDSPFWRIGAAEARKDAAYASLMPTNALGIIGAVTSVLPFSRLGMAGEIEGAVGNVDAAATSRMGELQAKWGDLTTQERRTLLDSKSEATWSNWLDQRDATAKAANPNTHFLEKHGPDTTLLDQEVRASTKLAPDGSVDKAFRDSTRFLSARDMGAAMQRADSIFQLNGGVNKAYSFTMEDLIGEGYTKSPGLDWMYTTNVNAVFRNGQPYTMFPLLRPIQ